MAEAAQDVWIDCDPGHDDALMLVLALHTPGLNVLGVSTVAGNMPIEHTTLNALKMLYIIDKAAVSVVAGAAKPLLRPAKVCPEIHGDSGLDGHDFPALPASSTPLPGKAVNVMAERIMASYAATGRKVVLVATGCLTNVALLLAVHPEVKDALQRIVIMGGAIGPGNTHPVCEFNIQIDPEAAAMVFTSGVHVVMVPLEVTHTALVTPDVFGRISALDSPFAALVHGLLKFFEHTYRTVFNFTDGPPLHDPCAIAYVLAPHLFTAKQCHVDVETSSPLTAGQTVVDLINIRGREDEKNATVCTAMDVPKFWDMMLAAIERANAVSVLNGGAKK